MRSKRVIVIGVVVGFLIISLGLALLLGRPQPGDEQQIYRLVAQGQQAVEKRNATGLTRLISKDYLDRSGVTRQQLVAMIARWMRSGEDFTIVPEVNSLQIRDPFADMALLVRIWRGRQPTGAGEQYVITARLRKEGRDWKVVSAEGWAEAQSDLMTGD